MTDYKISEKNLSRLHLLVQDLDHQADDEEAGTWDKWTDFLKLFEITKDVVPVFPCECGHIIEDHAMGMKCFATGCSCSGYTAKPETVP